MYLNPYQKYIMELLVEYGTLMQRQILKLVNANFKISLPNIDRYVEQLCKFGDCEKNGEGDDAIISIRSADGNPTEPNYDIIRSIDVLIAFLPKVIWHRRSRGFVSVHFFISTYKHDKAVSVVPVREGFEKEIESFIEDNFTYANSEIVIFLLEDSKQMKKLNPGCYHRFAVIGKEGITFYKPDNNDKQKN